MIGHIAAAEGAPCPTAVLDGREVPQQEDALRSVLAAARAQLVSAGHPEVLKFALLAPSAHPMFDLSYRFVQCIPDPGGDRFDFLGSCGHSIVASTLVADQLGWIPRLSPGHRVRVRVENNSDTVVVEVDELHRSGGTTTVHFLQDAPTGLDAFLLTGSPSEVLVVGSSLRRVSLVSMGNPYVFVRAADLGVQSRDELFAENPVLFADLVATRAAAAARLGFPATSAFPKVAVLDHFAGRQITVRAVSVPRWHPTLALTGATCLTVAAVIPGTVAHDVAQAAGAGTDEIAMETPEGVVVGRPGLTGPAERPLLSWVSVSGKRARYLRRIALDLVPGGAAERGARELVA